MTSTPRDQQPNDPDEHPDDGGLPPSGSKAEPGAEIGMTEGEGNTFEPEEDPGT